MNARDALADLIEDAVDDAIYNAADAPPSLTGIVASQAADAVLAAGYRKPRTITTPTELDALPEGSVIISQTVTGVAYQRAGGQWTRPGRYAPTTPAHIILPATVIHEPEAS